MMKKLLILIVTTICIFQYGIIENYTYAGRRSIITRTAIKQSDNISSKEITHKNSGPQKSTEQAQQESIQDLKEIIISVLIISLIIYIGHKLSNYYRENPDKDKLIFNYIKNHKEILLYIIIFILLLIIGFLFYNNKATVKNQTTTNEGKLFTIEACNKYVGLMICVNEKSGGGEEGINAISQTITAWKTLPENELTQACNIAIQAATSSANEYIQLGCKVPKL